MDRIGIVIHSLIIHPLTSETLQHGIEFGYIGGDPAELMRICVENGTFTVAFLKEGVQKFRGWIDDLLQNPFVSQESSLSSDTKR